MPRRVHVVGGPGSGKSTLARRLGASLGVPVHGLDAVAYEGGAGRKRALAQRRADAARIAAEPGWVAEGAFLWWTDDIVRAADVVVWLDVPWRVAVWRIVRRHAHADLAGRNPHRGYGKLAARGSPAAASCASLGVGFHGGAPGVSHGGEVSR